MNAAKLKGKMVEMSMNVDLLSEKVGMDRTTFYRKLNSIDKFTVGEADRIKQAVPLTNEEAIEIFFS